MIIHFTFKMKVNTVAYLTRQHFSWKAFSRAIVLWTTLWETLLCKLSIRIYILFLIFYSCHNFFTDNIFFVTKIFSFIHLPQFIPHLSLGLNLWVEWEVIKWWELSFIKCWPVPSLTVNVMKIAIRWPHGIMEKALFW